MNVEKARREIASGLMDANETLTALWDGADGIRAELTSRGYSPTAVEQVAVEYILMAMRVGQ